ncbi:sugar porter family MFS transporter [Limnoglobus roseus]|uniref:MFS transporter n=1 Tax=Limnoglobus roseus TaxID=2598579 RepID=A0A5C1AGR9_9BACT|nr:sugar porter family MFS transporter [Limnoglobus roseus]QEL18020.1 MFS transporter [Limnoglobus roseus]
MKSRILFWSITSALAGFLFGFDTVVISGAEKRIQSLWNLSPEMHGFAIASALYGTVFGSLFGGWPTDRFGRKPTLIGVGLLYIVSAVGCGLAWDVYSLIAFRLLGGIGIGVSTVAAPLYISEISPPAYRGRLAGMFQFNIVFGIIVAFLSNYLLEGIGENAWRWMLGVAAFPSLVYTVMCLAIPESLRWLLSRKRDREAGLRVLRLIQPEASPAELEAVADEIQAASPAAAEGKSFWTRRLRFPIVLAFLVAFFNQLSGINAILYFAPRIFGLTGLEEKAALLQSVGIGVTNLVFTFVGLWLIDRLGRRTLLYIGSFGYIASLGLCAWAFFNWAPQFHAASTALGVKDAVAAVQGATAANRGESENRLTERTKALEAASRTEGAGTTPISFPPSASHENMLQVADTALKQASAASGSGGLLVLACIFAFIAAHAIGQGAVIWVFISEIFPNRHRAAGQTLGSSTHWVFAALLTTVFPVMLNAMPPGFIFLFFCGMMVLQLLWVAVMVPETKGVPLEELERRLTGGPEGVRS